MGHCRRRLRPRSFQQLKGHLPPVITGSITILGMMPRVNRRTTAALAVCVLLSAALPLAFTVATGLLVGSIPDAVRDGPDSAASQRSVTLLLIAGSVFLVTRLVRAIQRTAALALRLDFNQYIQARIARAVTAPSGIAHLEDPEVADQIRTAQGVWDSYYHPGAAVTGLAGVIPAWLRGLGAIVILATFQWWLALIVLMGRLAIWHRLQRAHHEATKMAVGQSDVLRRAEYFRDLALTPDAAKELRVWGLLPWLLARFDSEWQRAMARVWQERRRNRLPMTLTFLGMAGVELVALALIGWAGVRGDIGLGAVAVFAGAVLASTALGGTGHSLFEIVQGTSSLPAFRKLEERAARSRELRRGHALPRDSPQQHVQFSGVKFRYPGQDFDVLDGLNLSIPAGQSLAIVGANGAGKTTLVKLLCRMYDPLQGQILVDSYDLRDMDARSWHERIAVIFQDFTRFHVTAHDNVGYGARAVANQHARLRAAAAKAGALELIESLPQGWQTVLSREYTGGMELSGGQWQRIALARALMAVEGGARLLILDEPTANLDVRAEAALYERFLEITAGLTTILISHRFSAVRQADRIVVLADGRIVEQGAHEELVSLGGQYAHAYELQASRFRANGGLE